VIKKVKSKIKSRGHNNNKIREISKHARPVSARAGDYCKPSGPLYWKLGKAYTRYILYYPKT
jgi:hypothetical protein